MPEPASSRGLAARHAPGTGQPVSETWPEFALHELAGLAVWWLSASAGREDELSKACEKAFGTGLPGARRFAEAKPGKGVRICWAGERQWFLTADAGAGLDGGMPAAVEKAGWATDQGDGWLAIRIEGARTRQVMEKLCGVDLHASVFATGAVARAPVEGMIALIACDDASAGTFTILFQRSSARSFLDHVRHAAHSTSPRG
ncbi:MAG: hypothetical protein VYD64_11465 [Pseudomonadota bacterium]|nr:hypothetical protein [Pseudomonadota bacterium]